MAITLIIMGAAWYFYNPKTKVVNTGEIDTIKWETYKNEELGFKFEYPGAWDKLNDDNIIFGIANYDNRQILQARLTVEKIDASNKLELQEVLNSRYQNCLDLYTKEDCQSVKVDDLQRLKISGETARIDKESKYLSETTIYIYANDYYLAIYEEYNDSAFLPIFEKMIDSIYLNIESKFKHYYCNRKEGAVPVITDKSRFTAYCYKVEAGDTLWSIAEKYYGDSHLWGQLKIYDDKENYSFSRTAPDDPTALSPGTEIVLWDALQFGFDERASGGITEGWGLDIDTADLFTTNRQNIYINKDIYDQGFDSLASFLVDERTNNKVYIVRPKREQGESWSWSDELKYQFVFNKQRNPYIGPGANFELLTFNHDEDKYVVRTNVKQDVPDPGFMALSNIGNGPEYDYLDSFIWYDNDTLVYRAQNDNQWRIVINHEDYKIYSYLENLRLEEDIIKFDARNEEGKWTQEEIFIDHDSYNAKIVSIPDTPPVGEGFMDYLRNTRSDLSEADLFRIEKNYHYKTGTLVDKFGNLVEYPVELYLEPVANMGMSEDIGRLKFTTKNGRFELFVNEIGPYTLSLQEGWSTQGLEDINPVDFRYSNSDYQMTMSNEEYDAKAKAKYIKIAKKEDTLWTMADEYYGQGYFWPLVAENSGMDYSDGIPEIAEGDELYFLPFEDFDIDRLEELRRDFHEKNTEEIFTINNNDFSYSIDYPSCWKIGSSDNLDKNYIHRQIIKGPIYRVGGKSGQYHKDSFVNISVYDNRNNMDFTEFIIDKGYTDSMVIDSVVSSGSSISEEWDNGGILMINGYYNDTQHLLFFKNNLVYDISFTPLYKVKIVDQILYQEILNIINSFKFIEQE